MEAWTVVFMLVILKIPLAFALYIIWHAIREEPVPDEGISGEERGPKRKPPTGPRSPRRGPAGGAGCRPAPCPQLSGKRLEPVGAVAAAAKRRTVH
jgi:hypothetical protein